MKLLAYLLLAAVGAVGQTTKIKPDCALPTCSTVSDMTAVWTVEHTATSSKTVKTEAAICAPEFADLLRRLRSDKSQIIRESAEKAYASCKFHYELRTVPSPAAAKGQACCVINDPHVYKNAATWQGDGFAEDLPAKHGSDAEYNKAGVDSPVWTCCDTVPIYRPTSSAKRPLVSDAIAKKETGLVFQYSCPPPKGMELMKDHPCAPEPPKTTWTCKDDSAVLFESVNGKHICVRF